SLDAAHAHRDFKRMASRDHGIALRTEVIARADLAVAVEIEMRPDIIERIAIVNFNRQLESHRLGSSRIVSNILLNDPLNNDGLTVCVSDILEGDVKGGSRECQSIILKDDLTTNDLAR